MAISLMVCIVGGIVYGMGKALEIDLNRPSFGIVAELGRLAFFAGLLAYLMR